MEKVLVAKHRRDAVAANLALADQQLLAAIRDALVMHTQAEIAAQTGVSQPAISKMLRKG